MVTVLQLTVYAWLLGVEDEQAPEETMGVEGNGGTCMCLCSLNKVYSLHFHAAARGGSEDPLDDVKSSGSEVKIKCYAAVYTSGASVLHTIVSGTSQQIFSQM